MTDSNTPKRRTRGRPKADPNRPRIDWRKLTILITPEQDEWLETKGEKAAHLRAMIDYLRTHPDIADRLLSTS